MHQVLSLFNLLSLFFQCCFLSKKLCSGTDEQALSPKHEVFIDPLVHQFPTALMGAHICGKITHTDQMLLWQKFLLCSAI